MVDAKARDDCDDCVDVKAEAEEECAVGEEDFITIGNWRARMVLQAGGAHDESRCPDTVVKLVKSMPEASCIRLS